MENKAKHVHNLVLNLVRELERCNTSCFAPFGVTTNQGYVLMYFPKEGTVTMTDLAEAFHVANSTMTRMIDQLIHKELVYRDHDPADRRVVRVGLAEKGVEVVAILEKAVFLFFDILLRRIPEEKHTDFIETFESLLGGFDEALEIAAAEICPA